MRSSIARAKEKTRQNEVDEPRHICRWCGDMGHFEGQKCPMAMMKRGGFADRSKTGDWLWVTAPPPFRVVRIGLSSGIRAPGERSDGGKGGAWNGPRQRRA